jgi:1-acyl-sn-glycerol-3-phosphate acyltransferase
VTVRLGICFQTVAVFIIRPYYWLAYRVRSWGRLPWRRGATLVLCNHQHDLDTNATIIEMGLGGPWDRPIYSAGSRRMFEPGFMATRIPWLRSNLRTMSAVKLFSALGILPIENELHTRSLASLARWIYARHGEVALAQAFGDEVLARLPRSAPATTVGQLFGEKWFKAAHDMRVSLKRVREPYRGEIFAQTRQHVEPDYERFERVLKDGNTLFLTPEGRYSTDGRMGHLRGALTRLRPFAHSIYLVALSYDVYVGTPFSTLFRILPPADPDDLDTSMRAPRPVTVSQLLASWVVEEGRSSFTASEADDAVRAALRSLPTGAFVDPHLVEDPQRMVRAALHGMRRLGSLVDDAGVLRLTSQRRHPQFPLVADMLAYQSRFVAETVQALNTLARQTDSVHDEKQVQRPTQAQVPPAGRNASS